MSDRSHIPSPTLRAGRHALRAIIRERRVLPALSIFHEELGDVFQVSLGAFRPVFLVGPEAARFVLVTARDQLLWRPELDPVTKLLRQGLLVTDGDVHDDLRRQMRPGLHRKMLEGYVETMWRSLDRVAVDWSRASAPVDMLVQMRRVALVIVMETLFKVDMMPDLDRLFPAILDVLRYISPGLWTVWPNAPRPGFRRSLAEVDDYLYRIIARRRQSAVDGDDLLGRMIATPHMGDDLIRDQMMTMLIAGHDTSTALLAWALHLLGAHPEVARAVREEVDSVIGHAPPSLESVGKLKTMERVLNETMRLYPPIHIGNRIAATDLDYDGYRIPAGTRVVYSIYLTHRHREQWDEPDRFLPDRFREDENRKRKPYTFLPFGGGRRNCIGAAFAKVDAKVVLSCLMQRFEFSPEHGRVHAHMGATLEPRPGVFMRVRRRS